VIKLKSTIKAIYEDNKLIFYNAETRQILVEIELKKEESFDLEEFRHSIKYYQTAEEISKGKFKHIILSLYKKKPEYFDYMDNEQTRLAITQNDIELTVDKNAFFLTFDYEVIEKLNKKKVVFWGESKTTETLANSLREIVGLITIYTTRNECLYTYSDDINIQPWSKDVPIDEDAIHIVYENEFSIQQLQILSELLETKTKTLYYKVGIDELIIGPLALGDETCSYQDYQMQYPSKNGNLSTSAAYIGAGIINRILYFLILDSLEYIGEDAQLPINSIFKMNTYTLGLDTQKIFKGVSSHESNSNKHF